MLDIADYKKIQVIERLRALTLKGRNDVVRRRPHAIRKWPSETSRFSFGLGESLDQNCV